VHGWRLTRNTATRAVLRSTLKRIEGELGRKTIAQVANDRAFAQRLIDEAPGSYAKRTRIVIVSPLNEAVKSGKLTGHKVTSEPRCK
jgi:hypothetical protein